MMSSLLPGMPASSKIQSCGAAGEPMKQILTICTVKRYRSGSASSPWPLCDEVNGIFRLDMDCLLMMMPFCSSLGPACRIWSSQVVLRHGVLDQTLATVQCLLHQSAGCGTQALHYYAGLAARWMKAHAQRHFRTVVMWRRAKPDRTFIGQLRALQRFPAQYASGFRLHDSRLPRQAAAERAAHRPTQLFGACCRDVHEVSHDARQVLRLAPEAIQRIGG